jgi:hypothetical protein
MDERIETMLKRATLCKSKGAKLFIEPDEVIDLCKLHQTVINQRDAAWRMQKESEAGLARIQLENANLREQWDTRNGQGKNL